MEERHSTWAMRLPSMCGSDSIQQMCPCLEELVDAPGRVWKTWMTRCGWLTWSPCSRNEGDSTTNTVCPSFNCTHKPWIHREPDSSQHPHTCRRCVALLSQPLESSPSNLPTPTPSHTLPPTCTPSAVSAQGNRSAVLPATPTTSATSDTSSMPVAGHTQRTMNPRHHQRST